MRITVVLVAVFAVFAATGASQPDPAVLLKQLADAQDALTEAQRAVTGPREALDRAQQAHDRAVAVRDRLRRRATTSSTRQRVRTGSGVVMTMGETAQDWSAVERAESDVSVRRRALLLAQRAYAAAVQARDAAAGEVTLARTRLAAAGIAEPEPPAPPKRTTYRLRDHRWISAVERRDIDDGLTELITASGRVILVVTDDILDDH